jgi:hypothetical protein
MKKPKVDSKVRIGGKTQIPHGTRGGGVPHHRMSEGVQHIGVAPTPAEDAEKLAGDCGSDNGESDGN